MGYILVIQKHLQNTIAKVQCKQQCSMLKYVIVTYSSYEDAEILPNLSNTAKALDSCNNPSNSSVYISHSHLTDADSGAEDSGRPNPKMFTRCGNKTVTTIAHRPALLRPLYEDENIIEEVPGNEISNVNPVYYMPHRPVIKLNISSTNIRPVFDASASCFNGVSLNDCLYSGPSLNPDLIEVLVRFRWWPIAITADIKKAFLQINVRKEDKDVHRFLLPKEDGTRRHMRFNRVPFGNTASPFLLNATIKTHLAKYPQSKVVQELKTDMYTDNWLSGADSVQDAHDKFCDALSILADCSIDLKKLVSNCMSIISTSKDGVYHIHDGDESSSVLGLRWCNVQDAFSFDCRKPDDSVEVAHTKRSILSIIAKMFDPLGLISPFIMYGKSLFQEVWKLKLDWDEELPLELKVKFQKWIHSSQSLNAFHVDRSYFPGMLWGDLKDNIELHGFGDASERGYGACVYLRVPVDNSSFKVSLVMSKSRVAPIKALTLACLELMGALVVKEIKEFASPECWQHCPSEENPAAIITCGVLADKLIHNSQWLYGPPMLSSVLCHDKEDVKQGLDLEVPCTTSVPICLSVQVTHSPLIDLEKFSDLEKALRVTAYVLRFMDNCKGRKVQGPLTAEEIELASLKLIYNIQHEAFANKIRLLSSNKTLPLSSKLRKLDPFIDDKGLLRIKGRLEFSELDYDIKHPFKIPKGKYAKLLIKFQHKYLKHAGVDSVISFIRTQFWIISVRKLAKTIIKECLICRWLDSRPCSQPVAPLPKERLTTARPFSVMGLDYAGPLFCADFPDKKFYVLLFTCGVVKAIHLELTESLSSYDCMLAIRKFVARRGLPNVIFSDNARTFMAAKSEVVAMYGHLAPKWKFIVPRSPWWRGWWERLIRSVKLALSKTLGLNYISVRELETVLVEIEECINVSEDPDPLHYLTPSHFILGCDPHSKPSVEIVSCNVNAKDLNERAIVQNCTINVSITREPCKPHAYFTPSRCDHCLFSMRSVSFTLYQEYPIIVIHVINSLILTLTLNFCLTYLQIRKPARPQLSEPNLNFKAITLIHSQAYILLYYHHRSSLLPSEAYSEGIIHRNLARCTQPLTAD
ncbi:uncharacterized protein LOC122246179 [Penaeus japonicus]|uniref:uncharacterized protein LOC122246179 n=1 Tax=Penaeus japonicus TaxID=27405 RepID=UPI001C7100AE|nr:uncharacterized protein LOC122246179 [Penaeus japonicus]